ncbi:MAG: hypothetical protein K0Q94_476 [Paenibacillus sp.]|jgi:AraC-like DNA-binding protein|nr:hypothetical protein [Paenibacillus sp.]
MMKKWFNRLFLSYVPIFLLISFSLLLITVWMTYELSSKAATNSSGLLVQNTNEFIDFTLANIESAVEHDLLRSKPLLSYLGEHSPESLDYSTAQAAWELGRFQKSFPFVHSVYLYSPRPQTVLFPDRFTVLKQFGDREFAERIRFSSDRFVWTGARPFAGTDHATAEQVVSLARYVDMGTRAVVVVNVSLNKLQEVLRQLSDSKMQYVELLDAGGQPMISSDTVQPAEPRPDSTVLAETSSAYTGWTVRSGQASSAMNALSSKMYFWIAIGLAVIVLHFIALLYVSRRNYKPIETIVGRLSIYTGSQSREFEPVDPPRNEYKLIESTIERLVQDSEQLEEKFGRTLEFRRRKLLLELLEGRGERDRSLLDDQLAKLGAEGASTPLFAALIEIDRYAAFAASFAERDRHLFKIVVYKVLHELAASYDCALWAEWTEDHRLAALLFAGAGRPQDAGRYAELFESFIRWIGENLDFTVTVAMESETKTIGDLPQTYRDLLHLLSLKPSLGRNRLLTPEDAGKPAEPQAKQLQAMMQTVRYFRMLDPKWVGYFGELHGLLRDMVLTREELNGYMNYFLFHLQHEMSGLDEFKEPFFGSTLPRLERIVRHDEVVDDIFEKFRLVLDETHSRFAERRHQLLNKQKYQTVENIEQYIREHYDNPDLSLSQLSEHFELSMSMSNISRLFKANYGVKLVDYLTHTRIERSKELLSQSDLPVQEVAAKVGYINSLTYIKVFKKMTGLTPGAYRKQLQESRRKA